MFRVGWSVDNGLAGLFERHLLLVRRHFRAEASPRKLIPRRDKTRRLGDAARARRADLPTRLQPPGKKRRPGSNLPHNRADPAKNSPPRPFNSSPRVTMWPACGFEGEEQDIDTLAVDREGGREGRR